VWANPPGAPVIDNHWAHQDVKLTTAAMQGTKLQLKWRLTADQDGLEFGGWNIDDVSLVRVDAEPIAVFTSYGAGCPGTGGMVPELRGSANAVASADVQVEVANGLPNGIGMLVASTAADQIPLSNGCFLLVALPYRSAVVHLDAQGSLRLRGITPPLESGGHLDFQFFGLDPGAPTGQYSNSNGVDLQTE